MRISGISFFAILLFAGLMSSCKQQKQAEAKLFYNEVHSLLDKAELSLSLLGDSIVSVQQTLRVNNDYRPDTSIMRGLWSEAHNTNLQVIADITALKDPEPSMGLKETALIYARHWQHLLDQTYVRWLRELNADIPDKAGYFEILMKDELGRNSEYSENLTTKSRYYKASFGF